MSTLTVTNLTSSRLPVGQFIGVLKPNEVRILDLTANELELSRNVLVEMAAAGVLNFATAPTSSTADNNLEPVLGGARVLSGTGVPNGVVTGSVGDLYTNKAGGALTTLYVKESGAGTNTGWVAK